MEAIQNGHTNLASFFEMLYNDVENELQKPASEMDTELIRSHDQLMLDMLMCADHELEVKEPPAFSKIVALASHDAAPEPKKKRVPFCAKVIGFASLFTVIAVVVGIFIVGGNPFTHEQSEDKERYIVRREEQINEFVQSGIASVDDMGNLRLVTTDIDEVKAAINFVPELPTWVPEGYGISSFEVNQIGNSFVILVAYEKAGEDTNLRYVYYSDRETYELLNSFEQHREGDKHYAETGVEVYTTINYGTQIAVWEVGSATYSVMGSITTDEALAIVNSIEWEGKN